MTLPVPISPGKNESPSGYLWRLAETNGFSSVHHLGRVTGYQKACNRFPGLYAKDLEFACGLLSKITGLDADIFRVSFDGTLPVHSIFEHKPETPIRDWRIQSPRICPDCLSLGEPMDSDWQHLVTSVCPTHRRRLMVACPHCQQLLQWHSDLASGCNVCGSAWPRQVKLEPVPAYQNAWKQAENRNAWEFQFGWALLRSARPLDAHHHSVGCYNGPPSLLPHLCSRAWTLMTAKGAKVWKQARGRRLSDLTGLCLTSALQAEFNGRHETVMSQNVDHEVLLPDWLRRTYDAETLSWLVDVQTTVRVLGLEPLTRCSPVETRFQWTAGIRHQAHELLGRLGVSPVRFEVSATRRLFDVRALDRWLQQIPIVPRGTRCDWVETTDPRLKIHGADQIDLALAVLSGHLPGYRRPKQGLSVIGVKKPDFEKWLDRHLEGVCKEPIEQPDLTRMTGMQPRYIRKHVGNTDGFSWAYVRQARSNFYTGESVLRFIRLNRDQIHECMVNGNNASVVIV